MKILLVYLFVVFALGMRAANTPQPRGRAFILLMGSGAMVIVFRSYRLS